jgi:hypothetical protein
MSNLGKRQNQIGGDRENLKYKIFQENVSTGK